MENKLAISEILKTSLRKTIDNIGLFALGLLACLGILLATIAISVLFLLFFFILISQFLSSAGSALAMSGFIVAITCFIILQGLMLGYTRMALDVYDTHSSSLWRLFGCFRIVPRLLISLMALGFLAVLILACGVIVGVILAIGCHYLFVVALGWQAFNFIVFLIVLMGILPLVIAQMYGFIRFGFFQYYLIEHNAGPLEALRKSWNATRGYGWDLFSLYLLVFIICGIVSLSIIGIFFAVPFAMLVAISAYREITRVKQNLE